MIKRLNQRYPWINARTAILAGLAIVVAVGLYANALLGGVWPYGDAAPAGAAVSTSTPKPTATKGTSSSALPRLSGETIEDLRNERERARSLEIKTLDGIISDKNASNEAKKEAETLKLFVAESIEKEATIESLLRAKGFKEVAVTIKDGAINVVLGGIEPGEGDIAKILDVAVKESGQSAKNVSVMTAK